MTEGRAPRTPTRTCVGCGKRSSKHELLRLVTGADGLVRVDDRGRASGRGAHVHRTESCVRNAATPRAVGRAFRGKATSPGAEALLGQARAVADIVTGMPETADRASAVVAKARRLTVQRPSD